MLLIFFNVLTAIQSHFAIDWVNILVLVFRNRQKEIRLHLLLLLTFDLFLLRFFYDGNASFSVACVGNAIFFFQHPDPHYAVKWVNGNTITFTNLNDLGFRETINIPK